MKEFRVNKNIRRIMDAGGKKVGVVAAKAGIRMEVFSNIIHCRRRVYADEVVGIADALGVSIDVLFADVPG